jgi:hypothetical protein
LVAIFFRAVVVFAEVALCLALLDFAAGCDLLDADFVAVAVTFGLFWSPGDAHDASAAPLWLLPWRLRPSAQKTFSRAVWPRELVVCDHLAKLRCCPGAPDRGG